MPALGSSSSGIFLSQSVFLVSLNSICSYFSLPFSFMFIFKCSLRPIPVISGSVSSPHLFPPDYRWAFCFFSYQEFFKWFNYITSLIAKRCGLFLALRLWVCDWVGYMCIHRGPHRGHQKVPDPLKLDFQATVTHSTWILYEKYKSYLCLLMIEPFLQVLTFLISMLSYKKINKQTENSYCYHCSSNSLIPCGLAWFIWILVGSLIRPSFKSLIWQYPRGSCCWGFHSELLVCRECAIFDHFSVLFTPGQLHSF